MKTQATAAKVTIVVDNRAAEGFLSEHGFSAWIEAAGRRILFDTGQGSALAGNAEKLGLDLRAVDTVVVSHGHYDHSGGIPLLLARAPAADVYAHPAATGPRYSLAGGTAKPIGMPEEARAALERHGARVRWIERAEELAPGLGLTGPIPRQTDYEDTGGPFFVDPSGAKPDGIPDDLALWIRTIGGLVVVVGCSHAGLVNTLRHALSLSGKPRLHAVIGGFHLKEASVVRLARTIAELEELGPELIVPCHCTGDTAVERLRKSLGPRVVPGYAGLTFRFDGTIESRAAVRL